MYEFGLPEASHIAVPPSLEPKELLLLTVGTLGDVAAGLCDAENANDPLLSTISRELDFSASFFDALIASRFSEDISRDVTLLAASAYYLAGRPGSSLVLARRLGATIDDPAVDKLLSWVLQARWNNYPADVHLLFNEGLGIVARLLAFHFHDGSGLAELNSEIKTLRSRAYEGASARELLFIDIISAVVRMRVAASAWTTLPAFTQIAAERWAPVIRRPEFPKELWPSQVLLGQAGIFAGASGVIQMPTSAGKTRSVEIVLRSGFLSGRAKLAVVVAPFRALCHEIGTSLRHSFRHDDVNVNELSDVLQLDFLEEVAAAIGSRTQNSRNVLVLTPEKFLYVLRQTPNLVENIGIVIYDEGHQFDSGSRGITYELLLTEIKGLLPTGAQTLLLSAVIQNAQSIGQWLIGGDVRIVNGIGLLPTTKSVAFASWMDRLGQLIFFESSNYSKSDFFVPRVIEQQSLDKLGRETSNRYFPEKKNPHDVSLYLGIRLAAQGAIAIFCGRKDTASGIAARVVDIYKRGFALDSPATFGNPDEVRRLKNIIDEHFGITSVLSHAASLGVFVHHGNTPHGLRLCIEYAMQQGRIYFVACTSTLAQGVNLPIRYLIVSGFYQGNERIKVRDFQNLVGRAGRAGMHTEGLVIFSDPTVYDFRKSEHWKFDSAVELLSPHKSEQTTSSLLELLAPFQTSDGRGVLTLPVTELCNLILSDEQDWMNWSKEVVNLNPRFKFDKNLLARELRDRRRLISAIESHLMANRGSSSFVQFKAQVLELATATLAHHLGTDKDKSDLEILFGSIAEFIQSRESIPERQTAYSKTLLGIKNAQEVEQWVNENRQFLSSLNSNEGWIRAIWPLFSQQSDNKFFHTVEPDSLPLDLAIRWTQGRPYRELFEYAISRDGTKTWGEKQRRRISDDDIINFCENTLGFGCSLVLAAVAQFLFGDIVLQDEGVTELALFQKSLKYGLPDQLSISCYEHGFSDRVVAQALRKAIIDDGYSGTLFASSLEVHRECLERVLSNFPSYFESVLGSRTA